MLFGTSLSGTETKRHLTVFRVNFSIAYVTKIVITFFGVDIEGAHYVNEVSLNVGNVF